MITALCFDTTKTGEVMVRSEISSQKNKNKNKKKKKNERFQSGLPVPAMIIGERIVTYCIPYRPMSLDKGTTYKIRDFF
jgi:hypothetical protein